MGHIPVGMEMFSASDDEQWKVIARHIDEIDYYVVLVAHRYGAIASSGISYTEKEFDYASSKKVPILGFVIDESAPWPSEKYEPKIKSKRLLIEFKKKIKSKLVAFWKSKEDLPGKLSTSLPKLIENNPRIGWIRSNQTEQEYQHLLSANDCIKDIEKMASSFHQKDKLTILHFGLDMALASDYVVKILNMYNCEQIDYKILIMAENIQDLDRNPPSDVLAWASYVQGSILRIKSQIKSDFNSGKFTSKKINLEIRQYFGTPIIHGIKIINKTNVTYLSMCQYKGMSFDVYDWGEFAYRRICDLNKTPSDLHLASTFHSFFERYWTYNSKVKWCCQISEAGFQED